MALVDKYTMKSKAHKNSVNVFMKALLEVKVTNHKMGSGTERNQRNLGKEAAGNKVHSNNNHLEMDEADIDDDQLSIHSKNNFFEILCDFCFFKNCDPSSSFSSPSSV